MIEPFKAVLDSLDYIDAFTYSSIVATIITMLAAAIGAVGTLRLSKVKDNDEIRIAEQTPFERAVLAKYYNQALSAANISFWFSLIFAAIGFGVIIIAFSTHTAADPMGTIIKVSCGAIIDAVSGLFFVQSQSARKSMADFFEKLRLDRLSAEAREMVEGIESSAARDQLRMQLVMKFSGIEKLVESEKS